MQLVDRFWVDGLWTKGDTKVEIQGLAMLNSFPTVFHKWWWWWWWWWWWGFLAIAEVIGYNKHTWNDLNLSLLNGVSLVVTKFLPMVSNMSYVHCDLWRWRWSDWLIAHANWFALQAPMTLVKVSFATSGDFVPVVTVDINKFQVKVCSLPRASFMAVSSVNLCWRSLDFQKRPGVVPGNTTSELPLEAPLSQMCPPAWP